MQPLRLGIISTAGINSLTIFGVVSKIEGIIVQAVASRNLKCAEDYANKHSIPQAYGNYDEVINLPYISCVYIPLPNFIHSEWTIKALNKGKNVLCEKPMATSLKEAKALIKTQKESGKVLMEAMHYRYHPVLQKAEEIIRGGEIGEIIEVSSSFAQWIPLYKLQNKLSQGKITEAFSSFFQSLPISRQTSYRSVTKEGVLWDMGCYCVDAVRWAADGDTAKVISAEMNIMHTGIDCETKARLLFSNGVKASIYVSYKHFFPMDLRVRGSKGSLVITSPFSPVAPVGPLNIPIYQMWVRKGISLKPYIIFPTETTYYYQLCAFRDAIISGQQPITSPQNCLANTKIIEAIIRKAGVVE